ncbi:MAG: hypothetical protein PHS48_09415 [Bacteroidales bacterium]|nr:hypothetical protein [Bacteroidales bacterium]
MSRLKQNQNIDSLIQGIETIIEDRCSLSDKDLLILNEALNLLKNLRKKKGKTNEQILHAVVEIVVLFSKFFIDSDEMPQ